MILASYRCTFPDAAAVQLKLIPAIVIDPVVNLTADAARSFSPTCCYGVDAEGVSYRMDNVPIRLRGALPTVRPTDESVLDAIIEAVRRCCRNYFNGKVYDPSNSVDAQVRDVWVRDGRIVSAQDVDRERAEIIDASGLVVMAGGVDIHSHVVGCESECRP